MISSAHFLNPSEAAQRLGVSTKALRLYEQHGLISPRRTAAGWRAYGPDEMARVAEIVTLRALGLGLSQIASVFGNEPQALERVLAMHQATLESRVRQWIDAVENVRDLRAGLAQRRSRSTVGNPGQRLDSTGLCVAFDLPWPWGGERFELLNMRPLNYIIGPLGSGKTRLAKRLAETLPNTAFLGLDRLQQSGATARAHLDDDLALQSRVDQILGRLLAEGASASAALVALLVGLEAEDSAVVVVDMVEQGLDQATQEALVAYLRRRGPGARPLFLLTRSCAILNLAAVGAEKAIIFCPANHSPPISVAPYPGAPGLAWLHPTCELGPKVLSRGCCRSDDAAFRSDASDGVV